MSSDAQIANDKYFLPFLTDDEYCLLTNTNLGGRVERIAQVQQFGRDSYEDKE